MCIVRHCCPLDIISASPHLCSNFHLLLAVETPEQYPWWHTQPVFTALVTPHQPLNVAEHHKAHTTHSKELRCGSVTGRERMTKDHFLIIGWGCAHSCVPALRYWSPSCHRSRPPSHCPPTHLRETRPFFHSCSSRHMASPLCITVFQNQHDKCSQTGG